MIRGAAAGLMAAALAGCTPPPPGLECEAAMKMFQATLEVFGRANAISRSEGVSRRVSLDAETRRQLVVSATVPAAFAAVRHPSSGLDNEVARARCYEHALRSKDLVAYPSYAEALETVRGGTP